MSTVQGFYDSHALYEWERLKRHRIEFELTMRMLAEHLPPPPARLLDVGGGPGRYSIALTQQGYQVTLFDLSAGCLDFARERAAQAGVTLDGVVHGNALDLSAFADESFDAVMVMGPMYHLLTLEERRQALAEARRVLKPGGMLGVAFISRYAVVLDAAAKDPAWVPAHLDEVEQMLQTGVSRNPAGTFTDAYSIHPTEVRPLLESCGFSFVELMATEGLLAYLERNIIELEPAAFEAWVALNYRLGKDPSVLGAACHLYAIGRR